MPVRQAPATARRDEEPTAKRVAIEARVVEAFEALLAEGGSYAELGIERIARRAGISRTAFYFYFRDKRELLLRAAEDLASELYTEAEGWWAGEGDPSDDLRASLERILAVFRRHTPLFAAVVEAAAIDEEVGGVWRDLAARFAAANVARIRELQDAGEVDADLDAEGTAWALVWMTERACFQHVVRDTPFDDARAVDALHGVWERAVLCRR